MALGHLCAALPVKKRSKYGENVVVNRSGIVVAILKMATGRTFLMSGINSGYHNLPTYEMSLKSNNVEFV
jgi:hypothetical protein